LVELKDSGSSFVLVPWQKIPEVAGDLFVGFLDKTAGMVDAAEGADRDALLARARAVGVDKATAFPDSPRLHPGVGAAAFARFGSRDLLRARVSH